MSGNCGCVRPAIGAGTRVIEPKEGVELATLEDAARFTGHMRPRVTALGLHSRACFESGNNRSHPPWAAFHWPPSAPSPAVFFHNAGDTYRKATLTRPKPCRTAIQIGDNTRGMVESDIATFATLVRTKLCYRGRCGVRGGMAKFNSPGGMVIVGVRISDFIREYQIANLCEQTNISRISVRNRVAWRCQALC